jgi:hypothetical protein
MRRKPPPPYVQRCAGYDYFRRPGYARVPLPGLPFSRDYMAAYQQAMANPQLQIGTTRSEAGSVAAAVAAYFVSPQFSELAAGTQLMRRAILQRFREQYGEHPINKLPPKFIALVLSKKKPHAARNWFKAIRALCQFASASEMIATDPTAGMKLPKIKQSSGQLVRSSRLHNTRPRIRWAAKPDSRLH